MKHLFTFLFCVLIIQAGFGQQTPIVATPSAELEVIKARLDIVESDLKKVKSINDSLNKELYYYRGKDDIVMGKLSQTEAHTDALFGGLMTFFTFLVAFFVGVGAYVNWQYYKNDLIVIRQNFTESSANLESLIDTTQTKVNNAIYELFKELALLTSGHIFYTSDINSRLKRTVEDTFYRGAVAIIFSMKLFVVPTILRT